MYELKHLAKKGVVVVSINYRLGPLGFLRLNEVTNGQINSTGNEGLIDQRSFKYSKRSPKGSFKNPILRNGDVVIIGKSGLNVASTIIKEITSPFIGIKAAYDILD